MYLRYESCGEPGIGFIPYCHRNHLFGVILKFSFAVYDTGSSESHP